MDLALRVITWGPVERKNGGRGSLGTAILLPSAGFLNVAEVENHFLAASTARSGVPAVQYADAGWSASGDLRFVRVAVVPGQGRVDACGGAGSCARPLR